MCGLSCDSGPRPLAAPTRRGLLVSYRIQIIPYFNHTVRMKRTPSGMSLKDHETRVGEVLVKKGIAFRDAEQTFKGGITRWMWRAHFVVD